MQRRLYWHAVLLVLSGLVIGVALPAFRNPRMGLTAHVGTLMGGFLMGLTAACWEQVVASERYRSVMFWLTVVANYANSAGLVLAAVFGTSHSTPIAGAGFSGTTAQELLVDAVLVGGALPTLVVCAMLLRALGGRRVHA